MQDARWTIRSAGSGTPRTGVRLYSGLCMSIALLGAAMPANAAQVAETIVRIYPTATVNCDQVMLTDVAALTGQGADLAANWAITAAPAPGHNADLELEAIQQALVRKGINPSSWVFRGASRCKISRPMPVRTEEPAAREEPVRKQNTITLANKAATSAPAESDIAGKADAVNPNTLEGVLRAHIAKKLAPLGGKPVVQTTPAVRELLQLSRPAYDFAITDRSDRLLGLVPFDVTIYRNGKVEQVRPILADVSVVKSVVVAAKPINAGQTITSDHVALKEMTFDKTDRIGGTDLNAVVGQRAMRFMNKDEMVTAKEIEPVPFVVRNDLVTVTARRGSITIKGVAKALSSASYGQAVRLRNESSKQEFVATVTGIKTADLVVSAGIEQAVSMAGGKD